MILVFEVVRFLVQIQDKCYAELTNQLGGEWEYRKEEWLRGMLRYCSLTENSFL